MKKELFETYRLGEIDLSSRIIMAPLTRLRAVDNTPNKLIATYYGQRAGAGLIVSEGTSPSPEGVGYMNMPGLYTQEHMEAWKDSPKAVHAKGGKIFLQMMHAGRVGHNNNLPDDYNVVGPSAIAQRGEMSTYTMGKQPHSVPIEMTKEKIEKTIEEYVKSTTLAMEAGFDGIEIHSAHGYLPNQFMNAFSPFEDRKRPESSVKIYEYLIPELEKLGILYIHVSNIVEVTPAKMEMLKSIRKMYTGTLIVCGDLTKETAQEALDEYHVDLVCFGRDFIANPDLVERLKNNWPLTERNSKGWYGRSERGYTDYPVYEKEKVS